MNRTCTCYHPRPGDRVRLRFGGKVGTIVGQYLAPGARRDDWLVELDDGGSWPRVAERARNLELIDAGGAR